MYVLFNFVDKIGELNPTPNLPTSGSFKNNKEIFLGILTSGGTHTVSGRGKMIMQIEFKVHSVNPGVELKQFEFSFIIGVQYSLKKLFNKLPI